MNEAYLCLGGNLGDCVTIFAQAVASMNSKSIITTCKSSVYTSQAWGMENAPDFFNQVVAVQTDLNAHDLMKELLSVEHELGRERKFSGTYESRTIDIDILLFNEETIHEEHLHIPHPRMHLRRFALEPLAEIAPGFVHPVFHKTISQLLEECPDKNPVKKLTHVA